MDLTEFQGIISNITIGEEGFVYILDENNVPVVHPELEIGEQMEAEWGVYIASNDSGMFDYVNMNGQEMRSTFVTNDLTGWTIGSSVSAEEIKRSASPIFNFTILVIVISVIVGIIIVYFVIRSIVRPLEQLKIVTEKVSDGDLTEQVVIISDDEIGNLGKTFNTMTSSLREIVGTVRKASNEMAATSEQLATSSEEVTVGVEEISRNTQQVASDAEGGNHATVEAAKVLLELSSLIQIAKEKSISATKAGYVLQDILEAVGKTVSDIEEIRNITDSEVGTSDKIVELINSLASIIENTAANAEEVAASTQQATASMQTVSASAEETSKLASDLQKTVEIFKV